MIRTRLSACLLILIVWIAFAISACASAGSVLEQPESQANRPRILSVEANRAEVPRYEHLELLHNGLWAAPAAGAAVTPMEWNDRGPFGVMTDAMNDRLAHLALFVSDLPLALLNPDPLALTTSDKALTAWGLGGPDWGYFWVQDISMAGEEIDVVRENAAIRSGVKVSIKGLEPGTYRIRPFDTWRGIYLAEFEAAVENGQLVIILPDFERDVAVKFEYE